jgi:hypothetical protein
MNSVCQGCRVVAPTKYVEFRQNIGAVILRFHRCIRGNLCRNCVNEHFSQTTLITSFCGWWGFLSLIMTPFLLLNNLFRYLGCLSLKPAPGMSPKGTALAWFAFFVGLGVLSVPFILVLTALTSKTAVH